MAESNDIAKMVQMLIDSPQLDRYFHADTEPERKPLVIMLEGAPGTNLDQVRKFGMPVTVRSPGETKGPVLSLMVERADGGETRLQFTYRIEGIAGQAIFSKGNGDPVLSEIRVVER